MLARSLATLPGVCALHEPQPHLVTEAYLRWSGRMSSDRAEAYIRLKREDVVRQILDNGLVYFESSHYWSHLIPQLRKIFGAKFVFIHRDARDFARSGLARATWYGPMSFTDRAKTVVRRRFVKPIGHPWFDHRLDPPTHLRGRVERLAWLWTEINGVILRDLAAVPAHDRYELPLEEIGRAHMEGLAAFLGLEPARNVIQEMVEVARQRPNSSQSSGREKPEWTELDEAALMRIAAPMMARLRYMPGQGDLETRNSLGHQPA